MDFIDFLHFSFDRPLFETLPVDVVLLDGFFIWYITGKGGMDV